MTLKILLLNCVYTFAYMPKSANKFAYILNPKCFETTLVSVVFQEEENYFEYEKFFFVTYTKGLTPYANNKTTVNKTCRNFANWKEFVQIWCVSRLVLKQWVDRQCNYFNNYFNRINILTTHKHTNGQTWLNRFRSSRLS